MFEINVDPVAFSIGSLVVKWYGIMMALGVVALVSWIFWRIKRGANISYDTVLTAAIIAIPSGIVFAKLLHVIDAWEYYSLNPGAIFSGEGLTIFGAIIGATIGLWIYSRYSHFNLGYLLDVAVPGILLGQAIGRVGCLLNGCCYGEFGGTGCSVIYTNPATAAPYGVEVAPTQAYEIIFLLCLFALSLFIAKKLRPDGQLFLLYISLYAAWRVAIGFVRVNDDFALGLEQAQVVGLILMAVAVPLFIYRFRKQKQTDKIT
ncbi:diacylglyceryl transferase [Dehalococcoides mccartyi]|jgi:phosphatidylglycerol:prolipoprotein diacylglycerol transferase|uniref:prolipoprotein diacylglyceryl transferase n=1 Tax=Dehalococcoides mccartyi TaxID=61435 RepID=UPI00099BE596|nr:prolipoprotein diacylglyceryl transferase [Dehalococcoides mccartyi]AQX74697.1 diacylglyceryl transferase [Dehalococcoides mccartyi]AQY73274.1 diacylglyceryl transferase [Dehalococcoides mccartyi]BEL00978.1 prolipoprotein diacylglyceryl transferase [Dehalococcoides mccartyi]